MSFDELAKEAGSGNRRALAKLVTAIESGAVEMGEIAPFLDEEPPPAPRIGITGPPGAGKSTLLSAMIGTLRQRGLRIGVLAVDPSSPLTGGALLGDRIRMQTHVDDPDVYVRSMANRGHLGGLAAASADTLYVMSRVGFDLVLVETVGVGQSEVEVMALTDLVVLVVGPGWGDQIQADKAGVVEVADVIVINKGDRPGVEEVRRAFTQTMGEEGPPIAVTTATTGDGVTALVDLILGELS